MSRRAMAHSWHNPLKGSKIRAPLLNPCNSEAQMRLILPRPTKVLRRNVGKYTHARKHTHAARTHGRTHARVRFRKITGDFCNNKKRVTELTRQVCQKWHANFLQPLYFLRKKRVDTEIKKRVFFLLVRRLHLTE